MFLRPLLVACVLGTSLSVASTGTVSLELVAATTLAWIFVVLIQLAAAIGIVVTAPRRTLPVRGAVDAFFALHVPWSAWLLAWAAWIWITPALGRHTGWVLWTAAAPGAWTAALIYRFCRTILADSRRGALVRLLVHQAFIWTTFLVIGGAAVGLWPRVLWMLGP